MSEQPKLPTLITPEDVERLNEAARHITEQWRRAVRAFGEAYSQALPGIREKVAALQETAQHRQDDRT